MTPNAKRTESIVSRIAGWIHRNDRQLISSGAAQMIQREVAGALDDRECRALLSLARWASKTATAAERAPVKWHRADEHYAKVDALRGVAAECRRRAKKGKP